MNKIFIQQNCQQMKKQMESEEINLNIATATVGAL